MAEAVSTKEHHGSCLCGRVELRIREPIPICVHCHCTMCQRNSGAGYVTWIAFPAEQLTISQGKDFLVRFQSSEHGSRSFCSGCGSTLLCEIEARPGEVDVPLANLAPGNGIEPTAHIFYDDRAAWTRVGDDLPRLGGETGVEPRGNADRSRS